MNRTNNLRRNDETGAALVTVVLITLLLGTACIALLTTVSSGSQNNTDALSEAKAYYAAESGLQAAIKVLRYDGVTYAQAIGGAGNMSAWLPYSGGRVAVGSDSYAISARDPDQSSLSTTYTTTASFASEPVGPWETTKYFPSAASADRTEIRWLPPAGAPVTLNHPTRPPYPELGSFQVTTVGAGGTISEFLFRIDYRMLAPRLGVRSIRGKITVNEGVPRIVFDGFSFTLSGSAINLCSTNTCVTNGVAFPPPTLSAPVGAGSAATPVFAKLDPLEPNRLVLTATGYGPHGSVKQLEAILQRNFFNNVSSPNAITMIGPNAHFVPGTSAQMSIDGGSGPSVGVSDANGLQNVLSAPRVDNMTPRPAIIGDEVPVWLSSAGELDRLVRQLRQTAQNSGRYFTAGPSGRGWGSFTDGTGITFCEGSCTMSGNAEGGGILVITGTFYTSGNPKFKGLVLAVGTYVDDQDPGGIVRGGGGNEIFIGNTVIAPYDPNNLAAGFQQPRYVQSGGPGDTVFSNIAVNDAFSGTSAITNFMIGISEK